MLLPVRQRPIRLCKFAAYRHGFRVGVHALLCLLFHIQPPSISPKCQKPDWPALPCEYPCASEIAAGAGVPACVCSVASCVGRPADLAIDIARHQGDAAKRMPRICKVWAWRAGTKLPHRSQTHSSIPLCAHRVSASAPDDAAPHERCRAAAHRPKPPMPCKRGRRGERACNAASVLPFRCMPSLPFIASTLCLELFRPAERWNLLNPPSPQASRCQKTLLTLLALQPSEQY